MKFLIALFALFACAMATDLLLPSTGYVYPSASVNYGYGLGYGYGYNTYNNYLPTYGSRYISPYAYNYNYASPYAYNLLKK